MNMTISLTTKANCANGAENIAKRELMRLAKLIAMKCGAGMACGEGNATPLEPGLYRVDATVEISGSANANDLIKDLQRQWMDVPEIVNSMIFVEEPPKADPTENMERCACCGGYFDKENMSCINPRTESEYWLCDNCLTDEDEIYTCLTCHEPISMDALVENPVTHEANLCPCCGATI